MGSSGGYHSKAQIDEYERKNPHQKNEDPWQFLGRVQKWDEQPDPLPRAPVSSMPDLTDLLLRGLAPKKQQGTRYGFAPVGSFNTTQTSPPKTLLGS